MRATIRDVAREAGLSVGAVSRYLNGRIELPEHTRKRIDDAVGHLDYTPNAIARRLSAGSSETLGLVTTDISYPFFAEIASFAEAEATALGYSLSVFNSRNDESRELQFLSKLGDRQLDGILLLTNHPGSTELVRRINALKKVVLLDEDVPGVQVPRLFADNERGGRLAARLLIEQRHRRVAFVGGLSGMISVDERLAGFHHEFADAGLTVDPAMILTGRYDEDFGRQAFDRLWRQAVRPTAIFAAADMLAFGVLRAARAAGVRVPQDVSLVSFDDMSFLDLLQPPLTTIRQSAEQFGREGVRVLVDMIAGKPVAATLARVPVELMLRGSVSPAPAAKQPARGGRETSRSP